MDGAYPPVCLLELRAADRARFALPVVAELEEREAVLDVAEVRPRIAEPAERAVVADAQGASPAGDRRAEDRSKLLGRPLAAVELNPRGSRGLVRGIERHAKRHRERPERDDSQRRRIRVLGRPRDCFDQRAKRSGVEIEPPPREPRAPRRGRGLEVRAFDRRAVTDRKPRDGRVVADHLGDRRRAQVDVGVHHDGRPFALQRSRKAFRASMSA